MLSQINFDLETICANLIEGSSDAEPTYMYMYMAGCFYSFHMVVKVGLQVGLVAHY